MTWQPTPVFLPGESQGQRNLVGNSPWGHKELDTTESASHTHTHTYKTKSLWVCKYKYVDRIYILKYVLENLCLKRRKEEGWKLWKRKRTSSSSGLFSFLKNKEILTDVTNDLFVYWKQN